MKHYVSISPELKEFFLDANIVWKSSSIEIDELYRIVSKYNKERDSCFVDLAELLTNSTIVKRQQVVHSENLSELEMMRRRAGEKRYQKSINMKNESNSKIGNDVKSASESISFATHFILAFASAFLLGYYAGEYVWGLSEPGKYICGGVVSFSTLILESVLFILRDNKIRNKTSNRESIHNKTSSNSIDKKNQ